MNRRRGCVWLAAGLVLATLAGVLIFITVQRAARAPVRQLEVSRVPALVAARDLPLRHMITSDDVVVGEVPPDMIPKGALTRPEEAIGQLTTADIAQGEIVLRRRLVPPDHVGPKVAFVMDPEKVVIAVPAQDLLSSLGILRPGDHVDMVFSFDVSLVHSNADKQTFTIPVLPDLVVADVVYGEGGGATPAEEVQPSAPRGGTPRALLFAVNEQEALIIKFFRDIGAGMDLFLRSPAAKGIFQVEHVNDDYVLQRYRIRYRFKEGR